MTTEMERHYLVLALIAIGVTIFVWALWPRPVSKRAMLPIAPFTSTANGFARHDFYRDIAVDGFTGLWPETSFDAISIDSGSSDCIVAVVTVADWIGRPEFETKFARSSGATIVKRWSPASRRFVGEATGLFVLPATVTGGTTDVCGMA